MSEQPMSRADAAAMFKPSARPQLVDTEKRLLALQPGERMRYLTEISGSTYGPACKAIMERIRAFASGLALNGRITIEMVPHEIKVPKVTRKVTVTEYFATGTDTGRRRCRFCGKMVIDPCQSSSQGDHCLNNRRAA